MNPFRQRWLRTLLLSAILSFLSMLAVILYWWVHTNGFSFTGTCINHFGELFQGNLFLHVFLGFFIAVFTSTIFIYFVGWFIAMSIAQLVIALTKRYVR